MFVSRASRYLRGTARVVATSSFRRRRRRFCQKNETARDKNKDNSTQKGTIFASFMQYGKAGLVTHLVSSTAVLVGLFAAVHTGLDTEKFIEKASQYVPLFGDRKEVDSVILYHRGMKRHETERLAGKNDALTDAGNSYVLLTNLAVAYAIYHLIFPARAALTTMITPVFVRYLRKRHPDSFLLR